MTPNPCAGWAWQRATAPFRRRCAAENLPCWLCGEPIDYSLPGTHKRGLTVDHIIARWAGGPPLDPTNWAPSHRTCNSARGAREGNARRNRPQRTELTW